MARHFVVAVYDRAAQLFGRPVFVSALPVAVRSFEVEVNRVADGNALNTHPGDHDLFELGEYEDTTAEFKLLKAPRNIAYGKQMVMRFEENPSV